MNLLNRIANMTIWVLLFVFLAGMVSLVSPEPQADADVIPDCDPDDALCYCNEVAAILRDSVDQDILTVEDAENISLKCYTDNL